MPDLNDELFSSFRTEGPTVNPLPASEVRRRGDRMRRRNNALAAVGGVAAALVIATPFAVLAGQEPDHPTPAPAPSPSGPQVDWLQQIPAGLPLTAGLVNGTETPGEPGVPVVSLCGQPVFDAVQQTVDVTGVVTVGTPGSDEPELTRTLVLYPDATAAAQAVSRIRDTVDTCPSEAGPGNHTVQHEVIGSDLPADEAFLLADRYLPAGEDYPDGIDYYVVARTGNAVLVTADLATVPYDAQVSIEQERVADLVDAMQVFSEAENSR